MRIDLLRPEELSAADLAAWAALQAADPALGSPYLCPELALAVGRARPDARVARMEDGGRAIGFLGFQRRREGVGKPLAGPLSDCQAIVAPAGMAFDTQALLRKSRLGAFDFNHALMSDATLARHARETHDTWIIDLSSGFDAYVEGRKAAGSQVRQQVAARARKLAAAAGEVRFVADDRSPQALATLVEWKRVQYAATGYADPFALRWVRDLLAILLAEKGAEFAGMLSTLYAGDDLVAAHLGIRSNRVWHYWFPGYAAEHGRHSPGLVLLWRMAEHATATGLSAIDLGFGDYDYKARFATHTMALGSGSIERPSLVHAARELGRAIEAGLKRIPAGGLETWPRRALGRLERVRALR